MSKKEGLGKLKSKLVCLKNLVLKGVKRFSDCLFPLNLTCNLCGKEVFDGQSLCENCREKIVKNDGFICATCGRKVPLLMERCFSCKGNWSVDLARSAFVYESEIQTLIKRYKYGNARYLADIFVEELKTLYIKNAFFADTVCGVPMTKERVYERGFNQSEYLAEKLAEALGINYRPLLVKRRETDRQAGLTFSERVKNLSGCFVVADSKTVSGKNVLIVDDVLTTGSTSDEIGRVLKKAGAKHVALLTVASTTPETF